MSFSDEVLMAYADGMLGAEARRAVELAMQKDAALARRVAHYKSRQANARTGFAPGDEAARRGQRLQATVINLGEVRARREASQLAAKKAAQPKRWTWQVWGALGSVLLLGVLGGKFGLDYLLQPDPGKTETIASRDGALTAQGRLAIALDQQLSSTQGGQLAAAALPASATAAASPVRIGATFVSNDGNYCRSFVSGGSVQDLAGLACRVGQEWRILLAVQNPRLGGFRSLELPAPVLQAVEQTISGSLLDPHAEHEAMQRGWQR